MLKRKTTVVNVGNVLIGGGRPIVVQSMTDSLTTDVKNTVSQVIALYEAGSEIVRLTVNNNKAAQGVVAVHEELLKKGYNIPLVGCFHYNGQQILTKVPDCAKALSKYRINPGNVGFKDKWNKNFAQIIETACKYNKPVRIGVNWGSLDRELLRRHMDENAKRVQPLTDRIVMQQVVINSALTSAKRARALGIGKDKIILSAKLSQVQDLISVYQQLAVQSEYPLHLGLTEAGMGLKGIVATTAALAILLQQGIGSTIRASITPAVGETRANEVKLCKQILQSLQLRNFAPEISSCPGCGRTTSNYFRKLAADVQKHIDNKIPQWKQKYQGVADIKIAVMGCIVNGPGESKYADIGISLPGNGENPKALVYTDGQRSHTLTGDNISIQFLDIIDTYLSQKCQLVV
jgi:(E)-4-hydroxy-3-methylbut-2-enyl-diphosphate synthase